MREWRSIPGFPGYEVSDDGQVRSIERMVERLFSNGARGGRRAPAKMRSQHEAFRHGKLTGLRVSLCRDGKSYPKDVHDLVLTAFVGPRPTGMLGLHWNDIPTDNRLSNLRWGSRRENMLDAMRNGLAKTLDSPFGIENRCAKLTFQQVSEIRQRAAAGESKSALSRAFGVSDTTIGTYVRGTRRVAA